MSDQQNFEAWRDESPNQRYGRPVWDAWQAACASKQRAPVLEEYNELIEGLPETPLERLRFFCSLALQGQDWLDVEPFFNDIQDEINHLHSIFRVNILRLSPDTPHSEIDRVLNGEPHQPPVEPEEVYSPHTKVLT